MSRAAARTGMMPTVLVAVEQYYPKTERVIEDSLALRMLPLRAKIFAGSLRPRWMRDWIIDAIEKSNPGIWGGQLCRKRYIDEKLVAAEKAIEAVVNLGAGLDTRAYRLPSLSSLPVWEIDQRENVDLKAVRLRKACGKIPANVKLIPVDFDREDLGAELARQGYSQGKRTFFVWEGVTQYLTEQGVRATFDFLAKAAQGSRLAFTYVRKDFLDGTTVYGSLNVYKRFVATKVWLFGMTPEMCPEFLQGYGWGVIEDVGYDELAKRYLAPTGRRLTSTPIERIVFAEKA
jgi:methyltransferase (TIGR00027 family)